MQIAGLDHINIAGSHELIARCRAFYVDVLGLTEGYRPPFRRPGFWLYAGGHPIVHLVEDDGAPPAGGATPFHHFALRCEGFEGAAERLRSLGVAFTGDRVPGENTAQLFLEDPAGVALELNFTAAE